MAQVHTHTVYTNELTPEMWIQGYRSDYDYMNNAAEEAARKKYYKKNGDRRKKHPGGFCPLDKISIPQ